jgi:hypothetical protein
MSEDPIVAEVRQIRERLAEQFDFDLHAIFVDLRERQRLLGSRLVRHPKRGRAEQVGARDRDSAGLLPGR